MDTHITETKRKQKANSASLRSDRIQALGGFGSKPTQVIKSKTIYTRKAKLEAPESLAQW